MGGRLELLQGDCRDVLPALEAGSVQCCVTSPPYWGLRDYNCNGQLGLETTPQEYIANMVKVFRDVWRVLKDDGTLWVNMGDSYGQNQGKGFDTHQDGGIRKTLAATTKVNTGLKPKDLCMMPARVAMALQADGWYLRSDIIWHKPNPMPESVTDRPTKSHEYIFLLAKAERYFYDADAIKEKGNGFSGASFTHGWDRSTRKFLDEGPRYETELRNKRSVWTVATQPYSQAHFATFPEDLIKPCILAGSKPGDIVIDPFAGSGTTGKVSIECGRSAILIELSSRYVELARDRTNVTAGFF